MMIGNSGCEFEDPFGVNLLPYFWRAGTGDRAERTFVYAAYTGLPGGVDTFSYPGGGGTVTLRADTNVVHGGVRCLEVNGLEPAKMPADGTGFRSPTLPARPGDTYQVSFWARGKDLKAADGGSALCAFVDFDSPTGQQRQRVSLTGATPALAGTVAWTKIEATVRVPDTARRATFFFGLRPCTGTLWLDDFSITVR